MRHRQLLFATLAAAVCLQGQIPDFTPPTPLFRALIRDDTSEAMRLLAAGANPNEGQLFGFTPIFWALMHQNSAVVKELIEKGADVQIKDRAGFTTLMWAAGNETADVAIVDELLKRGVDPKTKNKNGDTALSIAMRRGYTPVVELLKENGVSASEMIRPVDREIGSVVAKERSGVCEGIGMFLMPPSIAPTDGLWRGPRPRVCGG
jgi:ankyrin repeat protein